MLIHEDYFPNKLLSSRDINVIMTKLYVSNEITRENSCYLLVRYLYYLYNKT